MTRCASGLVISLALVTLIAACGSPVPNATATTDLFQAWSATPFPVGPAVIERSFAVCRRDSGLNLDGARVAAVDARGEGRINLVLTRPSGTARCEVLVSAGSLHYSSGGEMSDLKFLRDPPAVVPGAARLRDLGTSSETPFGGVPSSTTIAVGQAPSGVPAVDLVLSGSRRVRAVVDNGWFVAWWPTAEGVVLVVTLDSVGRDVIGVEP